MINRVKGFTPRMKCIIIQLAECSHITHCNILSVLFYDGYLTKKEPLRPLGCTRVQYAGSFLRERSHIYLYNTKEKGEEQGVTEGLRSGCTRGLVQLENGGT